MSFYRLIHSAKKNWVPAFIVIISVSIGVINPAGFLGIIPAILMFVYNASKDKKVEDLAKELEKEKKAADIAKAESEKTTKIITRIKETMKQKNISAQQLIEKLDKPLYSIILQKYNEPHGQKKIVEILSNLGFVTSGQGVYILRPINNAGINNTTNVYKWVDQNVVNKLPPDYKFIIKFAAIVDLRKVASFQRKVIHTKTVDAVLDIDDLLSIKNIIIETDKIISLKKVVEESDLGFLINSGIPENELENIKTNSQNIISALEKTNGKKISLINICAVQKDQLEKALQPYCSEQTVVATNIQDNSRFWQNFFI